jgi:hypothetical protein
MMSADIVRFKVDCEPLSDKRLNLRKTAKKPLCLFTAKVTAKEFAIPAPPRAIESDIQRLGANARQPVAYDPRRQFWAIIHQEVGKIANLVECGTIAERSALREMAMAGQMVSRAQMFEIPFRRLIGHDDTPAYPEQQCPRGD